MGFDTGKMEPVISAAIHGDLLPQLPGIIYSLGRDAQTPEEYDYAFRHLVALSASPSSYVHSMVILAFSLLAVFHGRLERQVVEPIIYQAWSKAQGMELQRIQEAVEDINERLDWGLERPVLP